MRLLPLPLLLAVLAACVADPSATRTGVSECPPLPDTATAMDAEERAALAASAGVVRRTGGTLTFRLAQRDDALELEEVALSADECVKYRYAGRVEETGHHLVRRSGYESVDWLLVEPGYGMRYVLISPPVVSPGGTRLAAANVDIVATYDASGLQVWRIATNGWLTPEVRLEGGDEWGATDPTWIDDTTLEFDRHSWGDRPDQPIVRRMRLKLLGEGEMELRPVQ